MGKLGILGLLLLVLLLTGCPGRPGEGGLVRGPGDEPVQPGDYTELEDDNLPLEGEGVPLEEELEGFLAPPKPDGTLYSESEIDTLSGQFRALTWNVRQFTHVTKEKDIRWQPLGAPTETTVKKLDAVLRAMKLFGVHIAALQEVYKPITGGPLPLSAGEGYTILEGKHIHINTKNHPFYYEFCPIAYRAAVLDCNEADNFQVARIHWVSCTIRNTTRQFHFGCGHLSTKSGALETAIRELFTQLPAPPPPHVGDSFSPAEQDNFILGLDANSHPNGHQYDKWDTHLKGLIANNPNTPIRIEYPPYPAATTTKIYKKSDEIRRTGTKNKRVIDLFIRNLVRDIDYKPGSTQVLDVRLLLTGATGQEFLLSYFVLSDHLPVKEDYTY